MNNIEEEIIHHMIHDEMKNEDIENDEIDIIEIDQNEIIVQEETEEKIDEIKKGKPLFIIDYRVS